MLFLLVLDNMLARVPNLRFYFFLFSFTCFYQVSQAANLPFDSVGVQVVNGNRFIVHQVVAKETLYTISNRYRVSEKKVLGANPQAKNGLQAGSMLYIPRGAATSKATVKRPSFKLDSKGQKIHEVVEKETLFSIARQFNLSSGNLKQWNNLTSDNVKIGQHLIVGLPAAKFKVVVPKPVPTQNTEPIVPVTTTTVVTPKNNAQDRDSVMAVQPKPIIYLRESGIAEVINGPNVNKYLALHATAPIGSYITVTNSMNGRHLSVRVIGTLPNTGSNDKVIVKISRKAQQRLAALDNRFMVDVVYAAE